MSRNLRPAEWKQRPGQNEEKLRMMVMERKSPVKAALLGFFFGPFGFTYIGWRYAVMAAVVFVLYSFCVFMVIEKIEQIWLYYLILLVPMAGKGYALCWVRNKAIDNRSSDLRVYDSFPMLTVITFTFLSKVLFLWICLLSLMDSIEGVLAGGHLLQGLVVIVACCYGMAAASGFGLAFVVGYMGKYLEA